MALQRNDIKLALKIKNCLWAVSLSDHDYGIERI